ncbi:hypothetical protein CVT26_000607, partial [Gymnopilus dilepis]
MSKMSGTSHGTSRRRRGGRPPSEQPSLTQILTYPDTASLPQTLPRHTSILGPHAFSTPFAFGTAPLQHPSRNDNSYEALLPDRVMSFLAELPASLRRLYGVAVLLFAGRMLTKGFPFFNHRQPDPVHLAIAKEAFEAVNKTFEGDFLVLPLPELDDSNLWLFEEALKHEFLKLVRLARDNVLLFYSITSVAFLMRQHGLTREKAIQLRVKLLTLTKESVEEVLTELRNLGLDLPEGVTIVLFAFTDSKDDFGANFGRFNHRAAEYILFKYLFGDETSIGRVFQLVNRATSSESYFPDLLGWALVTFLAFFHSIIEYSTGPLRIQEPDPERLTIVLEALRAQMERMRATHGRLIMAQTHHVWWHRGIEIYCRRVPAPLHLQTPYDPVGGNIDKVFDPNMPRPLYVDEIIFKLQGVGSPSSVQPSRSASGLSLPSAFIESVGTVTSRYAMSAPSVMGSVMGSALMGSSASSPPASVIGSSASMIGSSTSAPPPSVSVIESSTALQMGSSTISSSSSSASMLAAPATQA